MKWSTKLSPRAGYRPGLDIFLALDPAASEFYHDGKYVLAREGSSLTSEEMVAFWEGLCADFPIISIEGRHGRG